LTSEAKAPVVAKAAAIRAIRILFITFTFRKFLETPLQLGGPTETPAAVSRLTDPLN
jgi:hypothetical protein